MICSVKRFGQVGLTAFLIGGGLLVHAVPTGAWFDPHSSELYWYAEEEQWDWESESFPFNEEQNQEEEESGSFNGTVGFTATIQNNSIQAVQSSQNAIFSHLDEYRQDREDANVSDGSAPIPQGSWNAWISPYYRHSHRDDMGADGSTTKNDAGGGAFGADIAFGELLIGAGFDRGYTKSKYSYQNVYSENKSDFYGITMYADWARDNLRIYGGLGFSYDEHDLKVENNDIKVDDADSDTYAISSALICEYTVYNKAVYVTPYAGVRHAFIDSDDYKLGTARYDSDSLNIFRIPVGLKIGRKFRYSGFYIRPNCNLSIEPVCGDTKCSTTIHSRNLGTRETAKARMTDDFYWDASVGVTAGFYGISLTLAYDFHGSSHEKEHGVVLSYNWCF